VGLIVLLVDVESHNEVLGIATPSDGVDITDFGAATLELVGADVRAQVDGEVRWRQKIGRTRY